MTPGREGRARTLVHRTGLAVALGTGAGFACLGAVLVPRSILGAALVGALAALLGFAYVAGRAEAQEASQRHRRAVHTAAASGGTVALAVLALTGMTTVLGATTAPVLLFCVLATAPWVWTRLSPHLALGGVGGDPAPRAAPRPRTAEPGAVAPPVPAVRAVPAVESLSTLGLCGQWQRSYFALVETADPAERDRIAALRRSYLDELDRRDPGAVVRWLAADARPAGTSPARHLSPTTPLPGVKP